MKLCTTNTLQLHNCKKIDVISNESQILGSPSPQMKCYAQNKSHRPQQNEEKRVISGHINHGFHIFEPQRNKNFRF